MESVAMECDMESVVMESCVDGECCDGVLCFIYQCQV